MRETSGGITAFTRYHMISKLLFGREALREMSHRLIPLQNRTTYYLFIDVLGMRVSAFLEKFAKHGCCATPKP